MVEILRLQTLDELPLKIQEYAQINSQNLAPLTEAMQKASDAFVAKYGNPFQEELLDLTLQDPLEAPSPTDVRLPVAKEELYKKAIDKACEGKGEGLTAYILFDVFAMESIIQKRYSQTCLSEAGLMEALSSQKLEKLPGIAHRITSTVQIARNEPTLYGANLETVIFTIDEAIASPSEPSVDEGSMLTNLFGAQGTNIMESKMQNLPLIMKAAYTLMTVASTLQNFIDGKPRPLNNKEIHQLKTLVERSL